MCGSQYSSLLKRSKNIKCKFEDLLDCLCMRGTSAPWYVASRRLISAPHITATWSISAKSYKRAHMWNYFAKRAKLQKLRPVAPQPGGQGRGGRPQGPARNFLREIFFEMPLPPRCRAARSRPPGSGAAGVYSCKFPNRKYIFVKNENKKYKNKKKPRQPFAHTFQVP